MPSRTLHNMFGPNSRGIIIYDRSGWMSVQIFTANRPRMIEPATRTSGPFSPEEAKIKAAAIDTYYAYFGTWESDAAKFLAEPYRSATDPFPSFTNVG